MRKYIKISLGILGTLIFASCSSESDIPELEQTRAIVVNEGQFGYGTASLTTLSTFGQVEQDIFRRVNGRPMGDVAQSMTRINDHYYVPLNNSNKIEVFDVKTFESIETMSINTKTIPMYIAHLGGDSIVVTDQSSRSKLMIMDINHGVDRDPLRRYVDLEGRSFQTELVGNKLFVGGDRLWVFDLGNITESGKRTCKMKDGRIIQIVDFSKIVKDKYGRIWVLSTCLDNESYSNKSFAICIDPITEEVIYEIDLTEVKINTWVSCIDISPDRSTLYVNSSRKVYSIDTSNPQVPTNPILDIQRETSRTVYNMSVSKENTIFFCEVTYGSLARADIYEHNPTTGEQIQKFKAGIFPHFIYFE